MSKHLFHALSVTYTYKSSVSACHCTYSRTARVRFPAGELTHFYFFAYIFICMVVLTSGKHLEVLHICFADGVYAERSTLSVRTSLESCAKALILLAVYYSVSRGCRIWAHNPGQ
ncbi:hypothetical protein EJ08DRAFT_48707 [Tothia fuscella]|uniref:Uncharacterized protein n=1 Tax=Tothia fuscella TaxID=1048955 RepID=A0A9P4NFC9_9PEZI|nr:hypothetical protein EJ08DRAFT_48707 [Tothia fuscella]